jgi:aldehyde dehydrogenase (NAD+)
MTIAQEEIFGPVLVLMPYDDEEDAVRIANDSAYGLGGGVWSGDPERALRVARRLQCGQVVVNNVGAGGGGELPFGGVNQSGPGREMGYEALYGFSTLKTIAIKHD